MIQYLTKESEEKLKSDLEKLYPFADNEYNSGSLDLNLIPYLRRINAINEISTEQSCQGHIYNSRITGERVYTCGTLWIWLSRDKYELFLINRNKLLTKEYNFVANIYITEKGHSVVYILFNWKGNEPIDSIMEHITRFFEEL